MCAIGNKLFKLLSTYNDLGTILDSFSEDSLIKKGLIWIEDVRQNLENLLSKNEDRDHIFSFKRVYCTLSRNIFAFIGILSQTTLGDEYLVKKNFYALLDRFVSKSNKYDYILTTIIDNLNFNSKNVLNWITKLMSQGSPKIKRYIFDHIRCLIKYGKDIKIDIKTMINCLDENNPECNEVIIDILKNMVLEGKNMDSVMHDKNMINKTYDIDKSFTYVLMRNMKTLDCIMDIIDKELKEINIDKIINDYSNELKQSMNEVFDDNIQNSDNNKYFLNINLTKIENQYENYNEFYFLKQLPFNINCSFSDNKDDYTLITYMEYHKNNSIELCGVPQETTNIIFDPTKQNLQIKCYLGKYPVDNKTCKTITEANSQAIIFSRNDIPNLGKKYNKDIIKNNNDIITMNKNGISVVLKKHKNESYILVKIVLGVKINPSISKSVQTPINIITELNNNKNGYTKLVESNILEKLFKYLDINNLEKKSNEIKSVLWILAKLLVKDKQGDLDKNYKIVKKIIDFNKQCDDFAMKGTISYILSYISQNKIIKNILESYDYSYFFNTDICYPNDFREMYLEMKPNYINTKLNEEVDKINKLIKLKGTAEDIYNNISCLINNISFKQAILELEETNKNNEQGFYDINLFIKVIVVLSKYKFKQNARRNILLYIDKAINSNDFAKDANKIFKNAGKDVLTAHQLE